MGQMTRLEAVMLADTLRQPDVAKFIADVQPNATTLRRWLISQGKAPEKVSVQLVRSLCLELGLIRVREAVQVEDHNEERNIGQEAMESLAKLRASLLGFADPGPTQTRSQCRKEALEAVSGILVLLGHDDESTTCDAGEVCAAHAG